MVISGNRDCQFAPRSLVKHFIINTLHLGALFIPKWKSAIAECVLTTTVIASLLLELMGVDHG